MAESAVTFRTCGSCRQEWRTREEFVSDPALRLLGLQAVLVEPDMNLLVFEHRCGSTVSVFTSRLRHLLPEPAAELPSLRGTDACPGHCLSLADLGACERACSNARDRDLIRLVQELARERARPPAVASPPDAL